MPDRYDDTKLNFLDRMVGYFFPGRAIKRQAARLLLRQYAAAKSTHKTGTWNPVDPNINELVHSSQKQIRSRVRQLVRDFPYFNRAANVLTDLTIGAGLDFQARVKKSDHTYDRTVNEKIEYAFLRWSEKADISGRMTFNELVRLGDRSELETGESIFIKRKAPGRFVPFALQPIEPDRIAEFYTDPAKKNEIEQGIEFNPNTGQIVAYHIIENSYSMKARRVLAENIIHTFVTQRPEQLRGISPFACAVLAADDLHQYIDATLDTAKMASKYLAMVQTPDASDFQNLRPQTSEDGRSVEELENCIIEYLRPGEQIEFAKHNIPNNQFDPFTKFILRMVSIATGTSFELLSGDYSGLSYSNLKAIRADLVRGIKPRFIHRKTHFCNPVFREFLFNAHLHGKLHLPGYFSDPYHYERCQWIWPGMESPDPLREAKATAENIKMCLVSPQEVVAARGRDLEEVLDELEEAKKLMEAKGLAWEEVSTALANNPAAVDKDTSETGGRMNKVLPLIKRDNPQTDLTTRTLPISPSSLIAEERSLEAVMATEFPVEVFTWEHGLVREILLMDGVEYPDKLPLLDTHNRFSSTAVLGSVSGMRTDNEKLIGRVTFSSTASDVLKKVEEGHLTDFSVGYQPRKSVYIPADESRVINGREFEGPLLVTEKWRIHELSICPIGADEHAKARAAANYKNQKHSTEDEKMDPKLREMLIKRGMDPNATDEQAWSYLEEITRADNSPNSNEPEPPTADEIRNEAARMERLRVTEIAALGARFNMNDEAQNAINANWSLDSFRKKVLESIEQNPEQTPNFRAEMGETEAHKVRAAIEDSLLVRGGLTVENPAPGHSDFLGYTLRELAREMLSRSGQRPPQNAMEMVGRALTTSDFPLLLANVANKFLMEGYQTRPETWREWCGVGSVSDFKTHHLVRASETDDLDEIPEAAEYKYGKRVEAEEQYKVVTYGKLLWITRQAIINDDLNALSDTPRQHGESAARKVGDLPYGVLEANAAMGDNVALFHNTHANRDNTGVVSIATLNDGFSKMALQKDLQGLRRLNIRPLFYIGPVAKMGTVEQFFRTELIGGAEHQPNLVNIYAGGILTRVHEARVDDINADVWYLAGPKGKTVNVYFLNGVQTPYLETRMGWNVDGIEYKVRIDAGAKAVDWRALYRRLT